MFYSHFTCLFHFPFQITPHIPQPNTALWHQWPEVPSSSYMGPGADQLQGGCLKFKINFSEGTNCKLYGVGTYGIIMNLVTIPAGATTNPFNSRASYNAYGVNGQKFLFPTIWDPVQTNCKVVA
ncbi:hypothetical protein ACSBR1_021888 [Camellia fascicularis]